MQSVREIIKESCTRINLVPRRQAVPGDIQENAFRLLKGVVNKYNKDNLLSWTQNSLIIKNHPLIHIYDETDTLKGENNRYFNTEEQLNDYEITQEDVDNDVIAMVNQPELEDVVFKAIKVQDNVYTWAVITIRDEYNQRIQEMKRYFQMYHIKIRDVDKINSIYLVTPEGQEYKELTKLDYVNHTDFGRYGNATKSYTYTQKSQGEWLIEIKPIVARQIARLNLNYNEGITFDLDTDLYIPDNYIELLIVALAHKLALMYPRLDDAQMARLEKEVGVLVDNVKTPKASDRVLLREDYFGRQRRMSQAELMNGDWLYG